MSRIAAGGQYLVPEARWRVTPTFLVKQAHTLVLSHVLLPSYIAP